MTPKLDYKRFPVLYVDDERGNLLVFKHTFDEEFTVLTASSAREALEILAREPVAVLVTDQRMPEMSGVELAERVTESHPDIVRMILTAYSDVNAAVDAINRGQVWRYLAKPWRGDELASMLRAAMEIFHMAGTIAELQLRMLQSERLALVGFVAAGVAHDLKSPLACLLSNLESMQRDVSYVERLASAHPEAQPVVQEMQDIVIDCREETRHMQAFVESMRGLAAGGKPARRESVDLTALTHSAVRLCKSEVLRRARLSLDLPTAGPWVTGDPAQLAQVVLNLLVNAAQAIAPGRMSKNDVRLSITQEGASAVIVVRDTGKGIAAADLPHVFDAFYTTKAESGGTGLGLAIVKQIVTDHGGEITVESPPEQGAVLTIKLPIVRSARTT